MMKAETKAKIQIAWRKTKKFVRDWGLPIFGGLTIAAAWDGHNKATRNCRDIERLKEVVDNNAFCQVRDREKMLELEHQQNKLLEKALEVTEGKTD